MADAADAFDREPLLSIELVLSVWSQFVTELSPWCAMPMDDRSGELRRVLEELLDPIGGMDSEARRRRIRGVATQHGIFRRAQRCLAEHYPERVRRSAPSDLSCFRTRGVVQTTARGIAHELGPDFHVAVKAAARAYARLALE